MLIRAVFPGGFRVAVRTFGRNSEGKSYHVNKITELGALDATQSLKINEDQGETWTHKDVLDSIEFIKGKVDWRHSDGKCARMFTAAYTLRLAWQNLKFQATKEAPNILRCDLGDTWIQVQFPSVLYNDWVDADGKPHYVPKAELDSEHMEQGFFQSRWDHLSHRQVLHLL